MKNISVRQLKKITSELYDIMEDKAYLDLHNEIGSGPIKLNYSEDFLNNFNFNKWLKLKVNQLK